ncbi:MAG: AmmeMemoRadiSam system protein A [Gammaproteobacteria bacterium]|nr:AmmeMemoRadiSam system protein A [Gammaproteobacteria bacterium]
MINRQQQQELLTLCHEVIHHGLLTSNKFELNPGNYSQELQQPAATFVTLNMNEQLRGCIGSLQAYRSCVEDVAENACAAAFRDPRFPPLSLPEFEKLNYHVSILQPSTELSVESEEELIETLRPGIDGLIIEDSVHRATFLPVVWQSLPDARSFVTHLKQKAGLPVNYWSETLRFKRYEVQEFN